MTATTNPTAEQIAAAFCKELRACLTPEQLAEVVELNAAETDDRICHSHEFCDANQVLIDAMQRLVPGWEFNGEDTTDPIGEAWDIAKASGFSL